MGDHPKREDEVETDAKIQATRNRVTPRSSVTYRGNSALTAKPARIDKKSLGRAEMMGKSSGHFLVVVVT
jgi:hypothetical protein